VHMPVAPPPEIATRFVDPSYQGPVGLEFHDIPGAWAGRYGADDQRRIGQLYDAAVAATDVQIGRLLDALRSDGLYDRALVIVTADHGEELWDHGGFFHGHTLYDELLRVPLIVKFPGNWAAGSVVDGLARSIDILPTIADLLGRAAPAKVSAAGLDGESLVPLVTGEAPPRVLFATVGRVDDRSPPLEAVRTDTRKLILDMRTGAEELYDVVHDPGERKNLSASKEEEKTLDDLRAIMRSRLEPLRTSGIHVRLFNPTESPLRYKLRIWLNPVAPFVDLARLDMETGDVLAQNPRADGLSATGELYPGDQDELRFGVLATDGDVKGVLEITSGKGSIALCVADEKECAPAPDGKLSIPLVRMRVTAPPATPRGSALAMAGTMPCAMQWWMLPSPSAPISPILTPSDRERLRALGYAE